MPLRIGFQVWGQFATWPQLAAAARAIDRLGIGSLWANDHFLPAAGAEAASPEGLDGPVLEGWMTAAGFACLTERVPIGVLVSGAGYRNPALLLKMATALDHMCGGRASIGLGAGWHIRDHAALGFELPPMRERLDRLDEQAAALRALLDGREVTAHGRWVRLERLRNDPPAIGPLPLMIGGSGERRTLRIVARYADAWNGEGDPDAWGHRNRVLDGHCAEVGRDARSIRRTAGVPPIHLRRTRAEAKQSLAAVLERNGIAPEEARATAEADPLAGDAAAVARTLAAYADAGTEEVITDWPAPSDEETLERLATLGPEVP